MKTRNLTLIPAMLAFLALPVAAEDLKEFSEVDTDADGILSVAEAKEALPEVAITDMNGDGLVNPSEAEAAVTGLMLDTTEDKSTGYITEAEYQNMVSAIEERDYDQADEDDFGLAE